MNKIIKKLYNDKKNIEKQIKDFQSKCKHKKTYVGDYYWRIGSSYKANICDNCLTVVSSAEPPVKYEITTSTTGDINFIDTTNTTNTINTTDFYLFNQPNQKND